MKGRDRGSGLVGKQEAGKGNLVGQAKNETVLQLFRAVVLDRITQEGTLLNIVEFISSKSVCSNRQRMF